MAAIFSDTARFGRWLEIELLATEAWSALGVVPSPDAGACPVAGAGRRRRLRRRRARSGSGSPTTTWPPSSTSSRRPSRRGAPGPPSGSTTASRRPTSSTPRWCWMLRDAADLLLAASDELVATLKATALRHRDTVMIGRTHGIHAEPTTFGAKVALWACRPTATGPACARPGRPWRSASCPARSGTYSNIDPVVERHVCAALGLTPVPATQVIARDRHAEYLWACASVGATIELIAVELRHLQRTEVREVRGGVHGRPEGLVGHAPQAQPDHRRAPGRPGPHPAGQPAGRAARTSRCGTSGTSPTRRSSG